MPETGRSDASSEAIVRELESCLPRVLTPPEPDRLVLKVQQTVTGTDQEENGRNCRTYYKMKKTMKMKQLMKSASIVDIKSIRIVDHW